MTQISAFSNAEAEACKALIRLALAEDLGDFGDVTTEATIPSTAIGSAQFVARTEGVCAGLPAVHLVAEAVDARFVVEDRLAEGSKLEPGTVLARISGPMHSLLMAERTALNFLQRLGGVATLASRFVEAVSGTKARILDTRKTTPGWRLLEKYAVRRGGAQNHRMGLFDAILIKDNHLAALADQSEPIAVACERSRKIRDGKLTVEVEVDNLQQFDEAMRSWPDVILLDNFSLEDMRGAVQRRDAICRDGDNVQLEASGGVNLDTVRAIAETGVDRISVGAMTHSAIALDIGLDYAS